MRHPFVGMVVLALLGVAARNREMEVLVRWAGVHWGELRGRRRMWSHRAAEARGRERAGLLPLCLREALPASSPARQKKPASFRERGVAQVACKWGPQVA